MSWKLKGFKALKKIYTDEEMDIIYSGNIPSSKCCIQGCNKFVAGNTEERFCLEHWELHLSAICGIKF